MVNNRLSHFAGESGGGGGSSGYTADVSERHPRNSGDQRGSGGGKVGGTDGVIKDNRDMSGGAGDASGDCTGQSGTGKRRHEK
jgi:hypothetical protein